MNLVLIVWLVQSLCDVYWWFSWACGEEDGDAFPPSILPQGASPLHPPPGPPHPPPSSPSPVGAKRPSTIQVSSVLRKQISANFQRFCNLCMCKWKSKFPGRTPQFFNKFVKFDKKKSGKKGGVGVVEFRPI